MSAMKILACTDGSEGSLTILPHVRRMAVALGAEVVMARVLDPRLDAAAEVASSLEVALGRVQERWEADLRGMLNSIDVPGKVLVPHRPWGKDVADAIHDAADAEGAELVAMSSRGSGAFRHALLGSVAMGVIGRADLPVLTVAGSHLAREDDGPYHIVITSDGSPDSRSVFELLKPLLLPGKTKVSLLEVVTMKAKESEAEARARVLPGLEALRSRVPAGVETNAYAEAVPSGSSAATVIALVAQRLGADAIACATHGHTALRHLVAGSVALGVLQKAGMPVLLLKSKAVD